MREVMELPFAEIAVVVGASEPTVKSRMRYALEKLRAALADLAGDGGAGAAESRGGWLEPWPLIANRRAARMLELIYGELPAEARAEVDAHVAGCAACRAELAALESTRALARRSLAADVPPARARAAILRAAAAAMPAARAAARPHRSRPSGRGCAASGRCRPWRPSARWRCSCWRAGFSSSPKRPTSGAARAGPDGAGAADRPGQAEPAEPAGLGPRRRPPVSRPSPSAPAQGSGAPAARADSREEAEPSGAAVRAPRPGSAAPPAAAGGVAGGASIRTRAPAFGMAEDGRAPPERRRRRPLPAPPRRMRPRER